MRLSKPVPPTYSPAILMQRVEHNYSLLTESQSLNLKFAVDEVILSNDDETYEVIPLRPSKVNS